MKKAKRTMLSIESWNYVFLEGKVLYVSAFLLQKNKKELRVLGIKSQFGEFCFYIFGEKNLKNTRKTRVKFFYY